jgi:pyruvate carboxylase
MPVTKLLIANRGEIAVRIARAAAERGIGSVAVYSADDAASLHTRVAGEAYALPGEGVPAYLDIAQVVEAARATGCDAVHPGYGFLAENAAFARACEASGLAFLGPTPEQLELFGDKVRARSLAQECGVPVMPGTGAPTDAEGARAFLATLGGAPAIVKAVAGGGGRGMRVVRSAEEVDEALTRASAEASAAFGDGSVYLERLVEAPRHIEVQIARRRHGRGGALRRARLQHPAPPPEAHRDRAESGTPTGPPRPHRRGRRHHGCRTPRTRASARSSSSWTSRDLRDDSAFAFIEANPRLQVEHTSPRRSPASTSCAAARPRVREDAGRTSG